MPQDEFTKLFQFMPQRFDAIDKKLEDTATKEDIRNILARLDSIEKQLEVSEDERLVMGRQLERLNKWTHELAHKINYKLSV